MLNRYTIHGSYGSTSIVPYRGSLRWLGQPQLIISPNLGISGLGPPKAAKKTSKHATKAAKALVKARAPQCRDDEKKGPPEQ